VPFVPRCQDRPANGQRQQTGGQSIDQGAALPRVLELGVDAQDAGDVHEEIGQMVAIGVLKEAQPDPLSLRLTVPFGSGGSTVSFWAMLRKLFRHLVQPSHCALADPALRRTIPDLLRPEPPPVTSPRQYRLARAIPMSC